MWVGRYVGTARGRVCVDLYIHIYNTSTSLSIYLSVNQSIYQSINLSVDLSFYLPIYVSIYLFIYPSIHPHIHTRTRIHKYLHFARLNVTLGVVSRVSFGNGSFSAALGLPVLKPSRLILPRSAGVGGCVREGQTQCHLPVTLIHAKILEP